MMEMRRKDREISLRKDLLAVLAECKVCRLALVDEEGIYVVPSNFGFIDRDGQLTIYLHSAKDGRKVRAVAQGTAAGFELDCAHELMLGPTACEHGYRFKSIIGNGQASLVSDLEEKKEALAALMKQQTRQSFTIDEAMAEMVAVIKIEVSKISGKYHQ